MRIKPFKALYPNTKMVPSADSFFNVMKQEFPHYLKNSFFKRTKNPCMFLYRIKQKNLDAIGLITSTSVHDIIDNKILKHEHTLASKEQQMLDLALQRNAMIKPVLLAHKYNEELAKLYEKIMHKHKFFELEFEEEKAVHTLWKINDQKQLNKLRKIFERDITKSYIADGHHRVSTGILLNRSRDNSKIEFGDLLSIYFSFKDLRIYDYNRTVNILKEISPTILLSKLSVIFKITPIKKLRKPTEKFEIVFVINNEVYELKWKKKYRQSLSEDKVTLDARLLNKYVFEDLMGIKDVRLDTRISYITGNGGLKAMKQQLLKNDDAVGFLLYPVSQKELMAVADRGSTLPPKSTWFEPRIKNAVISQEFK